MDKDIEISQAIICSGGGGTRLKLGSKSCIIYKNKLLLEYCIISCLNANIKNIVITIPPKEYNFGEKKRKMLFRLMKKYSGIKFVRDDQKGFRSQPNYVRNYLDQAAPFYLLTGHSPQSSLFLRKLTSFYHRQSIVLSGYKYRYEKNVLMCMVHRNKIRSCKNFKLIRPRIFRPLKKEQFIIESPYILNYDFYDRYVKKDNYSHWIGHYVDKFVSTGNSAYCIENFGNIPEIDYKKDLLKALGIIDQLNKSEHYY
jgi:NDP-sugar pyrophosphorylase family protein